MSDRLAPNVANPQLVSFSLTARRLALLAALLGASGVALGAYQAHGLQRWLERQVSSASAAAPNAAAGTTGEGTTGEGSSVMAAASTAPRDGAIVARRLANAETAVRYQLVHAVALLTLALLHPVVGRRGVAWAGGFMLAGLVGFSGGLWQIVITGRPWHWAIVPAGGLLLIVAWLTLAITIVRRPASTSA